MDAEVDSRVGLPLLTKVIYGTGDWGIASFNTLRQIFYAIFLTDVVGLSAGLASFAALAGILWDALNDPLVGTLSDRVQTRWGRRRPFLLVFALPFGLCFLLLWWAPPWESQVALMVTITLAFMISDTVQTLISVPYFSLTPEITLDYDERTSLTGFRMFFNLMASLTTAVAAPMIVDSVIRAGFSRQQGYLAVAAVFGGLAVIPFLLVFAVVRERFAGSPTAADEHLSLAETARTAWANVPFRFATLLYMLNWITFDLVALILPFFLIYWVAGGDLLASVDLFGEPLALESAVLGLLLVTAVVALPLWSWAARRWEKRTAYIAGMSFWAVIQFIVFFVQPGQTALILALSVLAGLSVSTAHVLPEAIFPDVMEWDELRTRHRHEGVYYGVKNFVRKLTSAFAIFFALQVLGSFGYQTPPGEAIQFSQPDSALLAIRLLAGPVGSLLLLAAIVVAWFYPLTRQRHERIRLLLARREQRSIKKSA